MSSELDNQQKDAIGTDLELLFQAARTDPILRDAVERVRAEVSKLREMVTTYELLDGVTEEDVGRQLIRAAAGFVDDEDSWATCQCRDDQYCASPDCHGADSA